LDRWLLLIMKLILEATFASNGDPLSASTPEPFLHVGAIPERYGDAPGIATACDTIHLNPQEAASEFYFQRPAWLSPEIVAFAIGALDWCLVLAGAAAAFAAYFSIMDQTLAQPERHIITSLLAATVFTGVFERLGGYQSKQLAKLNWQVTRVVMTWGFTVAVLLLVAFLSKTSEIYSRGWAVVWIVATPILLLVGRCLFRGAMATQAGGRYLARNIAVVGAGDEGQRLIARLSEEQDKSVVIRGVFDDRKSRLPSSVCGFGVRGSTDDLLKFARQATIDEVIIALPLDAQQRLRSICDKMKALAIDVRLSLEPLVETFNVRGLGYVGTVPLLEVVNRPLKNWRAVVKWIEDRLLGALLLLSAGPLMTVIAILIKLDGPGPVFFVQRRFGFNNEVISVLKFRTMHVSCSDPSGAQRTIRHDPRVTRLGRILRWLSFDELPQLINVVRGDMSLVGPRPHAVAMKAGDRLYCEAVKEYLHRHRVKPGITGWAQVNGLRGEVDTLDKAHARVAHDLYYIEHWSPWLDLKILLKTAGILTSRENAY
jgi:Undecaprenyl-phosphate glucose phosphotransferase